MVAGRFAVQETPVILLIIQLKLRQFRQHVKFRAIRGLNCWFMAAMVKFVNVILTGMMAFRLAAS